MFESASINARLSKRISFPEAITILVVLVISLFFLFTQTGNYWDYKIFLATAQGDFENFFYGYWILPLFTLLAFLPFELSYLLWILLSVFGVFFAARVFNGNSVLALLSYQLTFSLFNGQISGILCGLLGLFWWAIHNKKWEIAGLAMLLVAAKPQSGGVFVLLLWLFSEVEWKQKARILLIPIIGFVLSLVAYPGWISDILTRMDGLITKGNVSLWQWVAGWSLLLLIPIILFPLNKEKRFLALSAGAMLCLPYFAQNDLLLLFLFPVGYIPVLLGYLPGILPLLIGYEGQRSGIAVPLYVYLNTLIPAMIAWIQSKRSISRKNQQS